MAMNFRDVSKMSVSEFATKTAVEGGAVVAGLIGAGFAGKQMENTFKPGVVPTSPTMDKVVAILANDGTKLGLYFLLRKYGMEMVKGETEKAMTLDVGKGLLGSAILDLLVRSGNDFAPGTTGKVFGIDLLGNKESGNVTPQIQANMQKVLQENSSLRQQLNSALQKVASASPNVTVTPIRSAQIPPPPPDHDRAYGMMQTTPEAEERRRNYGAMTPPIEDERNRRFGQMNKPNMNFAGESNSVASAFGML